MSKAKKTFRELFENDSKSAKTDLALQCSDQLGYHFLVDGWELKFDVIKAQKRVLEVENAARS